MASNNLIYDIGLLEKQVAGVEIDISEQITVSHNSIYNVPRAGINIGDGCWGGHIIEFNDVFDTVLETGDHGAFNSWGRDRFWAPNRAYMDSLTSQHPELILLDVRKPIVIRNNRFRCDHGWDIDLDDGSSNYTIYNNVLLNGGLKFREGFYRTAQNNIIINNSFHPHVWFKNSGDVFTHNIVTAGYKPIQMKNWGTNINGNFFATAGALANAQKNGVDKNSVSGLLQFKDPVKGDYTILPGSPAFKIGFENFPQDQFGVQYPPLKLLAKKPIFPKLLNFTAVVDEVSTINFNGAELKSVENLAERSVYGLADESGVIVLSVAPNSLLYKSAIQAKDVVLKVNGKSVKTVNGFLNAYRASIAGEKVAVEIMRNQQLLIKYITHE